MIMFTGLVVLTLAIMKAFPSTPLARLLHHWLVEWPIEVAARMERRHLILIGIILLCGPSLAALGSAELGMLYAVDLSLYAEAALMTSLSAVAVSLKRWWATVLGIAGGFRRGRPRQRSHRVRVTRRGVSSASNDDEPAWASRAA